MGIGGRRIAGALSLYRQEEKGVSVLFQQEVGASLTERKISSPKTEAIHAGTVG